MHSIILMYYRVFQMLTLDLGLLEKYRCPNNFL